jgi:hypothetical protein
MADAAIFSDISHFSPEEQAALNYHRRHLVGNTGLRHPDGAVTTFMGSVVDTGKGAMILPTYWEGTVRPVDQAMNFAIRSGIKFPVYDSVESALTAEKRMHDVMEQDVIDAASRIGKK